MDEDLRNKAMSFVEDMRKHLVEMHRLSAAGHQRAGTVTQSLLPAAMEDYWQKGISFLLPRKPIKCFIRRPLVHLDQIVRHGMH